MDTEFHRKIVVGGEGGVGKSTMLHRIITGEFQLNMQMTIGVDFQVYQMEFNNKQYKLSLWDLGGQDRFRFMIPQYCKGAHAGIIIYDLTRLTTVFKIGEWVKLIRDVRPNIPLLLVGSKADLIDIITIPENSVNSYMEELNFCDHIRISSKTGEGIQLALTRIVEAMIKYENEKMILIPSITN